MRKLLIPAFLILITFQVSSQGLRSQQHVVSFFNNSTFLPGKLVTFPVHPGITIGLNLKADMDRTSGFFYPVRLGYFYHKYSQQALLLYSGVGYWKGLSEKIDLYGQINAGIMEVMPDFQTFSQNGDSWEAKGLNLRTQILGGASLGISLKLKDTYQSPKVFLDYQFYLQTPFVKSYVPMLPNTALHLGVMFFVKTKN